MNEECIKDCDKALQIEPNNSKIELIKNKALLNLPGSDVNTIVFNIKRIATKTEKSKKYINQLEDIENESNIDLI